MTSLCAVVFAAGEGTRLRPLTTTVPKPLCPVGNVTLLDRALARLAQHGLQRSGPGGGERVLSRRPGQRPRRRAGLRLEGAGARTSGHRGGAGVPLVTGSAGGPSSSATRTRTWRPARAPVETWRNCWMTGTAVRSECSRCRPAAGRPSSATCASPGSRCCLPDLVAGLALTKAELVADHLAAGGALRPAGGDPLRRRLPRHRHAGRPAGGKPARRRRRVPGRARRPGDRAGEPIVVGAGAQVQARSLGRWSSPAQWWVRTRIWSTRSGSAPM